MKSSKLKTNQDELWDSNTLIRFAKNSWIMKRSMNSSETSQDELWDNNYLFRLSKNVCIMKRSRLKTSQDELWDNNYPYRFSKNVWFMERSKLKTNQDELWDNNALFRFSKNVWIMKRSRRRQVRMSCGIRSREPMLIAKSIASQISSYSFYPLFCDDRSSVDSQVDNVELPLVQQIQANRQSKIFWTAHNLYPKS